MKITEKNPFLAETKFLCFTFLKFSPFSAKLSDKLLEFSFSGLNMKILNTFVVTLTESRKGTEKIRTFDPTNESADCWSPVQSYNFIIRVE